MRFESIKITSEELARIYEDFAAIDKALGIPPQAENRKELAAKDDSGNITAYASGLREHRLFYISDLWVRKDLRRQGIGSRLLLRLEKCAAEQGCDEAYLWTAGEENALFYIANGYTEFVRFENACGVTGRHRYGLRKKL
ncbi:GNAT family N-acetyltransferase [Ruminococcus sp.]|uniref:GNAT family N-acetyltransferase n=1 Tax=Ruminococcus sp. TaxID=41978 RepID=UPI0025E6690A|nr:GNAT family N-acetyltransferase [Ruminococcus sp.]MBQ8964971.1 GNAT family N-acetyltransferase [Ruminococcus sp.]